MNPTADMLNLVWPLVFLLIMLLVLRQLRNDVAPVFRSVVAGLSQNAGRNAPQYAIAIGFGLSASLSAFIDVFKDMASTDLVALSWHQYATMWAKVANPFIVALLAYATQSNFKPRPSGDTPPPFLPSKP